MLGLQNLKIFYFYCPRLVYWVLLFIVQGTKNRNSMNIIIQYIDHDIRIVHHSTFLNESILTRSEPAYIFEVVVPVYYVVLLLHIEINRLKNCWKLFFHYRATHLNHQNVVWVSRTLTIIIPTVKWFPFFWFECLPFKTTTIVMLVSSDEINEKYCNATCLLQKSKDHKFICTTKKEERKLCLSSQSRRQ